MPDRRMLRAFAAVAVALTGCTALLGVNDVYYDADAPDGAAASDAAGPGTRDGSVTEAGDAAVTCDADLTSDPAHCGRCGHDCLGGTCNAGVCQAIEIGTVPSGRLRRIALSETEIFVSGILEFVTDAKGIWRIPKAGGQPTPFVTIEDARGLVVVGQNLYFGVSGLPADGGTAEGGLYVCPITAGPCVTPKLLAAARDTIGVTYDGARVLFSDRSTNASVRAYDVATGGISLHRPGAAPTSLWADSNEVFAGSSYYTGQTRSAVLRLLPDGGLTELFAFPAASPQQLSLRGTPAALYFAAYDDGASASGVVRRIPRAAGESPCSYGGDTNKRPTGSYQDATHIYWTNAGDGPEPWQNASVARCALAGCCSAPEDVLWTGTGSPMAIAGDDRAVYFVSGTAGSVWKLAKP